MSDDSQKICLDDCFMVDTLRLPARLSARSGSNVQGWHGRSRADKLSWICA
jgi:hypothetical protein